MNAAELHALALPVVHAVGEAPVYSLQVCSLYAREADDPVVEVDVHADDWRTAYELAARLGLVEVDVAPSLVMFKGAHPQWRCLVSVFAGRPQPRAVDDALDGDGGTAASPGHDRPSSSADDEDPGPVQDTAGVGPRLAAVTS